MQTQPNLGNTIPEDQSQLYLEQWIQLAQAQHLTIKILKSELRFLSENMETSTTSITSNFSTLTEFSKEQNQNLIEFLSSANTFKINNEEHTIESIMVMINAAISKITQMVVESSKHCLTVVYSFEELVEKFSKIESFLLDINSINKQTNILALNAKIEAQRVGSVGAGFDVVANEVKQLAAMVQTLSESISSQVKIVKDDLTNAFAILKKVAHIDMSENVAMKEKIDFLVSSLMLNNEQMADWANTSAEMINETSSQSLSKIVEDMQFQDHANQQIENITLILEKLETEFANLEQQTQTNIPSISTELSSVTKYLDSILNSCTLEDMRKRILKIIEQNSDADFQDMKSEILTPQDEDNNNSNTAVNLFD